MFPIEVKVNVDGAVDDAVAAIGIESARRSQRQIWFAEDRGGADRGTLRLLDAGVIIRFRSGEKDDVTVKLRPCTDNQLVSRWSAPFEKGDFAYRIEHDWSGRRRTLAASAVSSRQRGSLLHAIGPTDDTAAAIADEQRSFLDQCRHEVPFDQLTALGPVAATKFAEFTLDGLDVNAERWSVAGLDFLELSLRVKPRDSDKSRNGESPHAFEARAEGAQHKLEEAVRRRAVTISTNQENKTKRVLTALASSVRH